VTTSEGHEANNSSQPVAERRVAFERLRERTDELELIISGISLVALVAFPSWLFGHWARLDVHAEGVYYHIVSMGFPLAIGMSYTLAAVFLVHLATRAYWVGLIGLKATFPRGIRWDHIQSLGPLTREFYQRSLIDFDSAIDRADRFASVVFALVSLVTLSMLMISASLLSIVVIAFLVSLPFADSDRAASILLIGFAAITLLIVLAIPALDRGSRRLRGPDKVASDRLRRTIVVLNKVQNVMVPQRLLLPVQLMLESNFPRNTFSLAFGLVIFFTSVIGAVQMNNAKKFAPIVGGYTFLDDRVAAEGMRTAYYENLRSESEGLLRVPLIPSDFVADPYLKLFLPYIPQRDNDLLRARCAQDLTPNACLASLWQVTLDEREIDVASFESVERGDLGMRGLQGYIATAELAPGRHQLNVTWNYSGGERKLHKTQRYVIPFWFAPPYQQDLPEIITPAKREEILPASSAPADAETARTEPSAQ
jgi:hypothetical protein